MSNGTENGPMWHEDKSESKMMSYDKDVIVYNLCEDIGCMQERIDKLDTQERIDKLDARYNGIACMQARYDKLKASHVSLTLRNKSLNAFIHLAMGLNVIMSIIIILLA